MYNMQNLIFIVDNVILLAMVCMFVTAVIDAMDYKDEEDEGMSVAVPIIGFMAMWFAFMMWRLYS